MSGKTVKRRIAFVVALAAMLICILPLLSACNSDEEVKSEYRFKLLSVEFNEKNGYAEAYVALTSAQQDALEGVSAEWTSVSGKESAFYDRQSVTVTFDGSSIYSAVRTAATQGGLIDETDAIYRLKVYLRYDTIYRSIKSNADVVRSGREYRHILAVEDGQEGVFTLYRSYPNSANWYGLLIACAVTAFVVLTAIFLIKGKENAKREE